MLDTRGPLSCICRSPSFGSLDHPPHYFTTARSCRSQVNDARVILVIRVSHTSHTVIHHAHGPADLRTVALPAREFAEVDGAACCVLWRLALG
eukprot:7124997-Pyramimonas_sp.AAC.1